MEREKDGELPGIDLDGVLVGEGLGLVLAEVPGGGCPPVLLRPQPAAIGDGRYLHQTNFQYVQYFYSFYI